MEKQVEFKVGSETLRGTLFTPKDKGPAPAVVFFHGRGSDRIRYTPMAKKLSENGIIGLVFDFRGCGKSDGKFKNQSHGMGVEDGTAALEFLLTQDVDKTKIGIQGTSFGGFISGMLLNKYDFIKSVVLRVPAAYDDGVLGLTPDNFDSETYFLKERAWINSKSYEGLKKYKGNLLVIESEKDELIPSEEVRKYYEIAEKAEKRKLYIQKGASHSFRIDPEGLKLFHEITVEWFLETL